MLTPQGEMPIERLRPGDLVLSRDESNVEGKIAPQVIEEVFERMNEIVELCVGGRTLRTTSQHPFFVQGRGWTPAGELKSKDLLATDSGQWLEVEKVQATGNFRVANYHTYFVGRKDWGFAVWTHNSYFPEPSVSFVADHPFHYFIRDNATSTMLFLGRVSDPLQEGNDVEPSVVHEDESALSQNAGVESPFDEGLDGFVTPLDVLVIINHINASTNASAFGEAGTSSLDNNHDGVVAAIDALLVINWLNHQARTQDSQYLGPQPKEGESDAPLVLVLESDDDYMDGLVGEIF